MWKNEALKQDLVGVQDTNPDALKVFGYVENIDELFRVTSCMITKPGGITLSEAAALQVPVILYKPVPGQENENAMYFERKGAAVVIRDDSEVLQNRGIITRRYEASSNERSDEKHLSSGASWSYCGYNFGRKSCRTESYTY